MNAWKVPGFLVRPRFTRDGSDPADLVVLGAKVLTCDERGTRAQAVAVKDGLFAYVGDDRGANRHIGPETRVISARGRMLTPGFVDNHVHLLWMGLHRAFIVDLYDCRSKDDVISKVKAHAAAHPDLPVIMGIGWMYDYIGILPDIADLDAALPDRPVWLLAYDAMVTWPNTMMRRIMEERCPRACRRMVPHLDEKGEPTGLLMHSHSFDPFEFFTPEDFGPEMREKMLEAMRDAVRRALAVGVTAFDELQVYKSLFPFILQMRDRGWLDDARVRVTFDVDPIDLEDEERLVADLKWFKELGEKESGEHLVTGQSIKLYIDGTFGNHTSFMLEPFTDTEDELGDPVWTQEAFDRLMELADGMGLQACTHSIGDAGIRRALNSYQRAREVNGERDSRHRLDHCELPVEEDIERMARIGAYAAMQPTQFYGDPSFERTLGLERLKRLHPWRSLSRAGVEMSFGTDWIAGPLLPPINPFYGLMIAATRINYHNNTDWGPGEALDLEEAIRVYTLGGARALFMEDRIGSVEVGKCADFALFRTDLLKLTSWWFLLTHDFEPGKLDDFADLVVVGGRAVHTRPGARL
jgi:hypothetical protein